MNDIYHELGVIIGFATGFVICITALSLYVIVRIIIKLF